MNFSVIVTNFNNAQFLEKCISSVLAQTVAVDEIIVVDDGSSDGSVELLMNMRRDNAQIRLICQPNSGQTYALDAGIKAAKGDIICILDGDDYYAENYIEKIAEVYDKKPFADLVFCRFEPFGISEAPQIENPIYLNPSDDYDYGYSSLLTRVGLRWWIGNVASTISMRSRMARMLDLDLLAQRWNYLLEADYCLLLAVSALGGRKYYLARSLVYYRVKDDNYACKGTKSSPGRHDYRRKMFHRIVIDYYNKKLGIPKDCYKLLDDELATVPAPAPRHRSAYRRAKREYAISRGVFYCIMMCFKEIHWRLRKRG